MNQTEIDPAALAQLFTAARTHIHWQQRPVDDAALHALYELAKWGPTSMNCSPLRVVFVKSAAAKARLQPALAPGNVEKTLLAPVTAIVAADARFYERMPELFPAAPKAREQFAANPAWAEETAFRNSSLQGAYLMLAARALGLDCGPMSGFDREQVDAEFFAGSDYRSNFLFNLGYGVKEQLRPRGPRLTFDQAARIL
jgi:nitroreductase